MTDCLLSNRRILVAEDEYLIADEFCMELADVGAIVIGPAATLDEAIDLIASSSEISGAILDANLRGEMVFPVADLLAERGIPFVFTTGYDASVIPSRFQHITCCEKPTSITKVVEAIGGLMRPSEPRQARSLNAG